MISGFTVLCLALANIIFTDASTSDNIVDVWITRIIGYPALFRVTEESRDFWQPIIQKIILNLSDQQLLTGLGIIIAGFWTHCSISVYNFTLVYDLAWFSSNVHVTTLWTLRDYLLKRPVLRNWRVMLMVCFATFMIVATILQGHQDWYASGSYDAQCLFNDTVGNVSGAPAYWMSVQLVLLAVFYSLDIVQLFQPWVDLQREWFYDRPIAILDLALKFSQDHGPYQESKLAQIERIYYGFMTVCIIIVKFSYQLVAALLVSQCAYFIVDVFWFAYGLWGLLQDRDVSPTLMDGDLNVMTVGQIMPILLLASTAFVIREAYDGKNPTIKS